MEHQWIVDFECAGQFILTSRGRIDGFTPLLTKQLELTQRWLQGHIRPEPIPMVIDQFFDQLAIEGIILGATGKEGFSISTDRQRIERVKINPLRVRAQDLEERAATLLKAHQDPLLRAKLSFERSQPGLYRSRIG